MRKLSCISVLVVALAGGASDQAKDVPRATFESVAKLGAGWALPSMARQPWSRDGNSLVLTGPRGLYILDLRQPRKPPRRILQAAVGNFAWSPDGKWLLCATQSQDEMQQNVKTLVAVRTSGTDSTLLARADVDAFFWGGDGTMHYWDSAAGQHHLLAPPTLWQHENPAGSLSPSHPVVLMIWDSDRAERRPRRIHPDGRVDSSWTLAANPEVQSVRVAPPGGGRELVTVFEHRGEIHSLVMDQRGTVLAEFGPDIGSSGFYATSISADGKYVIGHHIIDDGHKITDSHLLLADSGGSWRVPVWTQYMGYNPCFSPRKLLVAFSDARNGGVHVGKLVVKPR